MDFGIKGVFPICLVVGSVTVTAFGDEVKALEFAQFLPGGCLVKSALSREFPNVEFGAPETEKNPEEPSPDAG